MRQEDIFLADVRFPFREVSIRKYFIARFTPESLQSVLSSLQRFSMTSRHPLRYRHGGGSFSNSSHIEICSGSTLSSHVRDTEFGNCVFFQLFQGESNSPFHSTHNTAVSPRSVLVLHLGGTLFWCTRIYAHTGTQALGSNATIRTPVFARGDVPASGM